MRKKTDRIDTEFISIPHDFYELHKFVTLTVNIMFVNCVAFLTTLSRKIRLFTIEHVPIHTVKQLSISLNKIVQLYARGGFIIHVIFIDMEFEKVQDELGLVQVNTRAAQEHVGEIEHGICTINDRSRSVMSGLPFKFLHKQVVVHLVYFCVMWLNAMPAEQGISRKYSPQEIVTQCELDFTKDCKAVFGSYVEASEDASVTNNMTPQTHACIALGPAGNVQGSQKCFDVTI